MAAAAQSQSLDPLTNNIATFLNDHQYRIISHVIVEGEVVDMVKASNRHGRLMYLHLDAVGCLPDQGVTKMIIGSIEPYNQLPLAMKDQMITMMDHTLRGIVCEQQDGLALIRRDAHGDLQEQTYRFASPASPSPSPSASPSPSPISLFMCYPLVNYSDVKAYPQMISEQCADSSDRIQHNLLSHYCCKLSGLNKSITALYELWEHYLMDNRKYIDTLLGRLHELRRHPTGCDDRLIREEIARDESLLCQYLNGLNAITSLQGAIDDVGRTIYREKKQLDRSLLC